MLLCSHKVCDATAISAGLNDVESTSMYNGIHDGHGITPAVGGSTMCPRYPRCKIKARTPSFQIPKSGHPVRRGICVTDSNDLGMDNKGVVNVLFGTEKVST